MSGTRVDTRILRATPIITGADRIAPGGFYRRGGGLVDYLLVLTLAGHSQMGGAERKFPLRPGDVILIEPGHGVDQDVIGSHAWVRRWAIFAPRPHWYEWLDWPLIDPAWPGFRLLHLPDLGSSAPVRRHLEQMHEWARSAMRQRHELAMNALEAALLWCDEHNPQGRYPQLHHSMVQAIDFVCRRLHQRLTVDHIAEAADVSVPHLARLFRTQLDQSIMSFVEAQRMQRAAQLLQMTAQPVAVIAQQVGFPDPFYFSTRFRRATGQSPRAYRRGAR